MTDRDMTPGDPLGGGAARRGEPERHPSGLPQPPREPDRPGLWHGEQPRSAPAGYVTPAPPGAGGARPAGFPVGGGGQLVLAGWWRRVGAALLDGVIVGAVALAIMAPLGIGIFATGDSSTGVVAFGLAFAVAALVLTVVAFLYAPFLMARTNGQTLGRMATGIRVVRTSGERMTSGGRCCARWRSRTC